LHDIIQIAMRWTNSHLHPFVGEDGRFDGGAFREHDPDFDDLDDEAASEKTTRWRTSRRSPKASSSTNTISATLGCTT